MKKTPGRAFYLSVTVIAICITCISIWSIAQNLSPGLKSVLASHVSTSVVAQGENLQNPTVTRASSTIAHASQAGHVASSNAKKDAVLKNVKVIADGAGVTTKDVSRVQSLLNAVQSPELIQSTLHLTLQKPVSIELVSNSSEYEKALLKIGVSSTDAQSMSTTTGGFTQNSTVIIPLNQNERNIDLANTLTHELTHAFINQNVGTLPSWLNEGIAVYMGMRGQQKVESAINFAADQRQLAEDILDVAETYSLQPLSGNENLILSGKTSYDYELQDWLAVSYLISHKGISSMNRYLQLMRRHAEESQAFIVAFGEREDIFNKNLTAWLQNVANMPDEGVQFKFSISSSYRGQIGLLQHGQDKWQAVQATAGEYTVDLATDGTVSGELPYVKSSVSSSSTDNHTAYISLFPSQPLKYQGHRVTDAGFAFDMHNGLYAFQNAWITLDNGNTVYKSTPSLFGVSVVSASELNREDPLLAIFTQ